MSHLKERKEKICLNCNADLYGRFCHVCGQENLEPKETVWHLITHFFNDITHFDGKFFSTVKYLVTKPGFLAAEYMAGRRASYLNPIRMYVFTSAIFFLVLFSTGKTDSLIGINEKPEKETTKKDVPEGIKDWEKRKATLQYLLDHQKDTAGKRNIHEGISALDSAIATARQEDFDRDDAREEIDVLDSKIAAAKKLYGDTSTRKFTSSEVVLMVLKANADSLKKAGMPNDVANGLNKARLPDSTQKNKEQGFFDMLESGKYPSLGAYDSIQQAMPGQKRDGWLEKIFYRRMVKINAQVKNDRKGYVEHFRENFLHSFPKLFFFALPFFALILKLVYIRRKNYYYTDHGIFTINLFCVIFIFWMLLALLSLLGDKIPWHWFQVVTMLLSAGIWLSMFIYLYKAMRRFYKQGRGKTLLKFILVGIMAFIVDLLLLVVFLFISAISV